MNGSNSHVLVVSAPPGTSVPKRPRDEEQESSVDNTETTQEDPSEPPIPKKLRIIQRVGPEVSAVTGSASPSPGTAPDRPCVASTIALLYCSILGALLTSP